LDWGRLVLLGGVGVLGAKGARISEGLGDQPPSGQKKNAGLGGKNPHGFGLVRVGLEDRYSIGCGEGNARGRFRVRARPDWGWENLGWGPNNRGGGHSRPFPGRGGNPDIFGGRFWKNPKGPWRAEGFFEKTIGKKARSKGDKCVGGEYLGTPAVGGASLDTGKRDNTRDWPGD